MTTVPLRCSCGRVTGTLDIGSGRHLACHCKDCLAWREHLTPGREGGVEIFQTTPDRISIDEGWEYVACARLTKNGLVRWHTSCCNTALANTLPKAAVPFAGIVTDIVPETDRKRLGPLRSIVNRPNKPHHSGMAGAAWGVISRGLFARLSGKERHVPFFSADGTLEKEPVILN